MVNFLYILLAIAILLFMVIIHELGHYLAGKLLRFKINEFSIGLGPKLFSKKLKNGEVFSLRALPLGGYCAFMGEDEIVSGGADIVKKNEELSQYYDSKGRELIPMNKQSVLNRIIVLLSGAAFNLVSAVLFSIIFIAVVGYSVPTVNFNYATANSSAFLEGDKIIAVNNKDVSVVNDFSELISKYKAGDSITLTVVRQGTETEVQVKKIEYSVYIVNNNAQGSSLLKKDDIVLSVNGIDATEQMSVDEIMKSVEIGSSASFRVVRANYELMKTEFLDIEISKAQYTQFFEPLIQKSAATGLGISTLYEYEDAGLFYAIAYSVPFTAKMSWTLLSYLGKIFVDRTVFESLSGPVTTVMLIADATRQNLMTILILLPLIAANLGIFNLLPIPALDGSRVVFCLIEAARGKPINRNLEAWIHFIGLISILGLVILVEFLHLLR